MNMTLRALWVCILLLTGVTSAGKLMAGGLVDIPFSPGANPNDISNSWWPMAQGDRSIYFNEEGCELIVIDVMINGGQSRDFVDGVPVREVLDRAFVDDTGECDADILNPDDTDWELIEITRDWYAQDSMDNVWYFGEDSVAFDVDECDRWVDDNDHDAGCRDGSWIAGEDLAGIGVIAEPGIVMLASPEKGLFYRQEYYEDEAEDMAKIINFKPVDSLVDGELDNCVVIKEWAVLEPGSVEHKYFCQDHGLELVEGLSGGPTEAEELVYFQSGLP